MEALKKAKIAAMEAAFAAMEEDRKYRIKNKDRRDLVRAKLDLRAMWNDSKINPITQKFKDKQELEEALRKQEFIKNSLKQKNELEAKLAEIHENDVEKQQALREKLAVINENTNEESLAEIEVKLQGIQMRANQNNLGGELEKWKGFAEDYLEEDLQNMAKNYQSTDKKLLATAEKDNYLNPLTANALANEKPEFGIANEDVPEHLKQWIVTPQKFYAYKDKHPEIDGDSESNVEDGSPGPF